MSTPRRRALQIDDPLSPGRPGDEENPPGRSPELTPPADAAREGQGQASSSVPPREPPGHAGNESRPVNAAGQEPPAPSADAQEGGVWRAWSGVTEVGSFRLPHELLLELSDTARQHRLPIGLIVTAAITQLLDQPPEHIAQLVDQADDARIHGRRAARRRLTNRTDR